MSKSYLNIILAKQHAEKLKNKEIVEKLRKKIEEDKQKKLKDAEKFDSNLNKFVQDKIEPKFKEQKIKENKKEELKESALTIPTFVLKNLQKDKVPVSSSDIDSIDNNNNNNNLPELSNMIEAKRVEFKKEYEKKGNTAEDTNTCNTPTNSSNLHRSFNKCNAANKGISNSEHKPFTITRYFDSNKNTKIFKEFLSKNNKYAGNFILSCKFTKDTINSLRLNIKSVNLTSLKETQEKEHEHTTSIDLNHNADMYSNNNSGNKSAFQRTNSTGHDLHDRPSISSTSSNKRIISNEPKSPILIKSSEDVNKKKHEVELSDLNEQQLAGLDLAKQNKSFCLIGAAGSGKTTTQKVITQALYDSGIIPKLNTSSKHIMLNSPAILICSFTNKAVNNIRDTVPDMFKGNCLTIHKVIEMAPVFHEEENEEGLIVKKKKWKPNRNEENKLPDIKYVIVEEASSVGIELFLKLTAALPNIQNVTFVFLGDLNQLPPVMDDAVLGYALNYLPVVELTKIYRTALLSPITQFAHKILEGNPLNHSKIQKLSESYDKDQIKFIPLMKHVMPENNIKLLGQTFKGLIESEKLNPETSVVLCPYNVGGHVNVKNLNNYMAQGVSTLTNNDVFEIVVGWSKYYYSVGDILFSNKTLCRIVQIERNSKYYGVTPKEASKYLDRWGKYNLNHLSKEQILNQSVVVDSLKTTDEIFEEFANDSIAKTEDNEDDRSHQASHIVTLEALDSPEDISTLQTAAEYNNTQFGYCLTIHKAMGSEWINTYLVLTDEHNRMLNRELLYTGVTRARKSLSIIYQADNISVSKKTTCSFMGGIVNQAIKGKSLAAKLDFFKDKETLIRKQISLQAKVRCRKEFNELIPEKIQAYENLLWSEHPVHKIIKVLLGGKELDDNFVPFVKAKKLDDTVSLLDKYLK